MNGVGFELVVQWCAGTVRIDVVDPLGFDLGLAQGPLHRQHGAVALGRCGHVEGVVARAIADHLSVDPRAALLGMFQLLEQKRPGPFRDHKAVAIAIEGARRLGWVLVLGERPHGAEPGVDDRDQHGFRFTGHDRLRVAPTHRLKGLSHGATPGRAGRDYRHVRATQPKRNRNMPRGGVDQHVLNKGGADPFQPTLLEDTLLLEEDSKSTCCASEDHPDVIDEAVLYEPGIGECLLGRDQPELGIAVHPAELLRFDHAGGIEALHLAGDLHRVFAGVEERHLADPRLPFEHGGPGTRRIETNRRHRPHPGHDDALHPNGDGVRTRATSRSLRVTTCASWLMRRIRPESTWPGPISRNSALPRATISTTDEVHWTGLRMWSASSLRMSSALVRIWPVMLATTGIRG